MSYREEETGNNNDAELMPDDSSNNGNNTSDTDEVHTQCQCTGVQTQIIGVQFGVATKTRQLELERFNH